MRPKGEQSTGGRANQAEGGAGGPAAGKKRKAEPEKPGSKRHPLAGLSRAKRRRIEQERLLAAEGGPAREAAAKSAVRAAKKAARPVRMSQFGDGEQLRPTAGQLARAKRQQEKERKRSGQRARSGKRRAGSAGGGGGGRGGFEVDLGTASKRRGAGDGAVGRGPKGGKAAGADGRAGAKPGAAANGLKVANKRTNRNAKKARSR